MFTPIHIFKSILFYIVFSTISSKCDGLGTIARHDVTGKPLYVYLFIYLSSWGKKDIDPFSRHTGTMIRHNQSQSMRFGE